MQKSTIIALISSVLLAISGILAIWGEVFGFSAATIEAWGSTALAFVFITLISGFVALVLYDGYDD
jgi:hypothetical protein